MKASSSYYEIYFLTWTVAGTLFTQVLLKIHTQFVRWIIILNLHKVAHHFVHRFLVAKPEGFFNAFLIYMINTS